MNTSVMNGAIVLNQRCFKDSSLQRRIISWLLPRRRGITNYFVGVRSIYVHAQQQEKSI
jgi:hypothetical protein